MVLTVRPGSPAYFGRPAKPLEPSIFQAVAELLSSVGVVAEAHFPQAWVPAVMTDPAQVLVVVLNDSSSDSGEIMRQIKDSVASLVPKGRVVDVWFVEHDHSILDAVRRTGCQIA